MTQQRYQNYSLIGFIDELVSVPMEVVVTILLILYHSTVISFKRVCNERRLVWFSDTLIMLTFKLVFVRLTISLC